MFDKKFVAAVVIALLMFTALAPRRARATDITTPLIIGGAVVGAATLITVIAVLMAHDDEPHFLSPEARVRERAAVRVGLQCKTPDGQPALLCW
ncbi:MAG: hypothetical protein HYR72_12915 [Deltaproteobacteria bacterium]|nr:hypothetical protein [Deltaproteobacteria bacterium]MBI3390458.1 hypothetical protein [Deltaproteobacteria bacterium]